MKQPGVLNAFTTHQVSVNRGFGKAVGLNQDCWYSGNPPLNRTLTFLGVKFKTLVFFGVEKRFCWHIFGLLYCLDQVCIFDGIVN